MSSGTECDPAGQVGALKLSCADLLPLLREGLRANTRVRLTTTGNSMRPFLRDGDVLELVAPGETPLQRGQVALVAGTGTWVLHRITRVDGETFRMRGDAHLHDEGPFTRDQVVALVDMRLRGTRARPVGRGSERTLALLWQTTRVGPWAQRWADRLASIPGRLARWRSRPAEAATPTDDVEQMLIALCRAMLTGENPLPASGAAFPGWRAVADLAEEHGVAGILIDLPSATLAQIPSAVRARVDAAYMTQAARNGQALRQLAEVADALRAEQIACLPLKGASLLRRLYTDLGHRALSDIDLLVPEGMLARAEAVLSRLGYTPMYHEHEGVAEERVSVAMNGHSAALGRPGGLPFELHVMADFRLADWAVAGPDIWAEASFAHDDGVSAPSCTFVHELLLTAAHCCDHAAHGQRLSLKWVLDGALLVKQYRDGLDWPLFWETAERWQLTATCRTFLGTVHAWWGIDVPGLSATDAGAFTVGHVLHPRKLGRHGMLLAKHFGAGGGQGHGAGRRLRHLLGIAFPSPAYLRALHRLPEGRPVWPLYLLRALQLTAGVLMGGLQGLGQRIVGRK
jgi:signal peptidase I